MPDVNVDLYPKQNEALTTLANETLYGGAAGGGKSHLMRVAAIIWCYLVPGIQIYIFRRLSTDLYKNHMEGVSGFVNLLEPWVRAKFVQVVQPGTIKFRNGSRIFLNHCQYEHNVSQYQGTDIHVLMIDELTHWTEPMYTFLRGRCRVVGLKVPQQLTDAGTTFPRILCGTNPGGVGHNWVKAMFVDLTNKGRRMVQMDPDDGGMLRSYIPAKVTDNPALMRDDPTYISRLKGLGNPALVKAMSEGDWDIVAGGMFDDVWLEEAIVLPKFPIPSSWKVNRSFDWGESKPFSVGWWAETGDEEVEIAQGIFKTFAPHSLIRIAEWYGWDGKKPNVGCKLGAVDIARGIRQRESQMQLQRPVDKGPADSAIYDISEGTSIAMRMADEGVHWTKADKRAGSRINGWSLMREMFQSTQKVPMEGAGLFCFPECEHFIRTISTLPRDKKQTDDVDTDSEDHVGDETRYRVWRKRSTMGVVKTVGTANAD